LASKISFVSLLANPLAFYPNVGVFQFPVFVQEHVLPNSIHAVPTVAGDCRRLLHRRLPTTSSTEAKPEKKHKARIRFWSAITFQELELTRRFV